MDENFIGIFPEAIPSIECIKLIQYFESLRSMNLVLNRQEMNDSPAHKKNDETAFLLHPSVLFTSASTQIQEFLKVFWNCYNEYINKYSILNEAAPMGILHIRLQKTSPGGGYHVWHHEDCSMHFSNRVLAWTAYLNTIEDGGETEFLYQHKRIKAEEGKIIIWPAGFTHTHRGNPPLEEDKYILTGWIEFLGCE